MLCHRPEVLRVFSFACEWHVLVHVYACFDPSRHIGPFLVSVSSVLMHASCLSNALLSSILERTTTPRQVPHVTRVLSCFFQVVAGGAIGLPHVEMPILPEPSSMTLAIHHSTVEVLRAVPMFMHVPAMSS